MDTVYETNVRSLRCYAARGQTPFAPPIRNLTEDTPIVLDFDVLKQQYTPYQLYIIPCDANWQLATVGTSRFVTGINQYIISDFSYSIGARVPYVHYRVVLPEVLAAGNYVAAVHRGSNRQDLLLTARFMVYSGAVEVQARVAAALGRNSHSRSHRLDVTVRHDGLPNINPFTDLLVHIRQNRSWLHLRKLQRPTRTKSRSTLVYSPVYGESDFCALPSFRRFDTRRLRFRNLGIANWQQDSEGRWRAQLQRDRIRSDRPHAPERDLNGGFIHGSAEPVQGRDDYVEVQLSLEATTPFASDPYVVGNFNHWRREPEAQLHYDSSQRTYTTTMLLKQGYYEYLYWVSEGGFEPIEGCWAQSENEYEIFVYHIDRARRAEALVGYLRLSGTP